MPEFRIGEAARLLGVSDDTVRRWADAGRLRTAPAADGSGRLVVPGTELARFATDSATSDGRPPPGPALAQSTRNRITGLVTRVLLDGVMAQVEMQAGPFRVVSLMSREAADELGLEPGVLAVAAIKATNVAVELAAPPTRSSR